MEGVGEGVQSVSAGVWIEAFHQAGRMLELRDANSPNWESRMNVLAKSVSDLMARPTVCTNAQAVFKSYQRRSVVARVRV